MTVIEVFADVACPFTHVGLRRVVDRRTQLGRHDVTLLVRAWPLEVVNGQPLDPRFIAEEVDDIRQQVAPTLFAGFTEASVPTSSLPALSLAGPPTTRTSGRANGSAWRFETCSSNREAISPTPRFSAGSLPNTTCAST